MKKTLALVLALAMVFSTITVAFAEDVLSADAQVCSDLGMLKGATGTVDAAYTATTPTRIQAAVMLLRLKGLEAEAMAFTGEANFADADQAAWAKPIMAYLKANPQLGWAGDGTNFNPTGNVTAQMYYKVMLESLGYKQNTAEVVGDFTWENVVEFAAGLGLSKVAAVTNFTVNDLAIATVEALKANVKDSETTLVASLVEAGKIDEAKAVAAGLVVEEVTTTDATLKNVKAVANDKVEVEFTADIAEAFAANAENFAIVVKGSTTALEVKSAVLDTAKKAVVETAAQTAGTAYTLTVAGQSKNFDGLAKDSGVPKVDSVECTDTNTVEVVFTKAVDRASALDLANYTLNNGATVKAAALNSGRTKVTLTTEGVAKSKVYNLKVENVKSTDLVAMKATTESFKGIIDDNAPEVDKVEFADSNARLTVIFEDGDDEHGISKESAENLENYSITAGTETVAIEGVALYMGATDDNDYYDRVVINTEAMAKGTEYTLTVKDIVDGSVSANKMSKAYTKKFRGKAADDDAPELDDAVFISDTKLKVVFDDDNKLDAATAEDPANYEISDSITVKEAKILDNSYPFDVDALTVILTTSAVEDGDKYTLTVNNVSDEYGNTIKADSTEKNIRGEEEDVTPPYVTAINSGDTDEIVITFDSSDANQLDKASAEDPTNYEIAGITVKKAELEDDRHTVTLTTSEMDEAKEYKVIINNVADINGNAMNNVTVKAIAYNGVDNERPEIEEITVEARNLVKVTFNEKVVGTTATMQIDVADTNGDYDGTGLVTLNMVGNEMDGETAILFRSTSPFVFANNGEYRIDKVSFVKDKHNNAYAVETDPDDRDTFDGDDSVNEGPTVDSIEQTGSKEITVVFDEPVLLYKTGTVYTDSDTDTAGVSYTSEATSTTLGIDYGSKAFDAYIDEEDDDDDAGWSTLVLKFGSAIEEDKTLGLNFSEFVSDYAGAPAIDEDDDFDSDDMDAGLDTWASYGNGYSVDEPTYFETYFEDEDGPEIVDVRAKDRDTIEVVYDEDIDDTTTHRGSYKVEDEDEVKYGVAGTSIGDEDYIVEVDLSKNMSASLAYTLTVNNSAYDLTGNDNDDLDGEEYEFVGSSVMNQDYITGIEVVDARTIKVKLSKKVATAPATTVKIGTGDDLVASITAIAANTTASSYTVVLKQSLIDEADYTVATGSANFGSFTFEADVDKGDLEVEVTMNTAGTLITSAIVEFSDFDTANYVVKVVYDETTYVVAPVDTTTVITDADYHVLDTFELTSNWLTTAGADSTINLATAAIPDDSKYIVEVYRAQELIVVDIDATGYTSYFAAMTAAGVDAAPIYSAEFTK